MQHLRVAIALSAGLTVTAFGASAQTSPPSPDFANAARSAAQQQQLIEQQRQAQERAQTVNAPAVRSGTPNATGWPDLPTETPCFRIQSFVLDVPATLPDAVRAQGDSALPQDRFAFAREWLDHYSGQCVGKQGVDLIVKGLSQVI